MIAIPTLFRKLENVKNVVRPLSKKQLFTKSFKTEHLKQSKTLVKSASEHFHHVFLSLWKTVILTGNDNYPVQDSGNFSSAIQMHLSLKPKIFSYFFVLFLESTSNFEHFEKKDDRHTYFIS